MENKTIRKDALNWFKSKFQNEAGEIYTSKFYSPQESWSNSRVWFFQIPLAYTLAKPLALGPVGVFAAIPIAETAISIAAYMLFKKGKWKLKKI